MPAEIKVPSLGESIVEATIGRWLKNEGDTLDVGEPVVELETDKVNMEVPSNVAGRLAKIEKQEGETVAVGDTLALVDESAPPAGQDGSGGQAEQAEPSSADAPAPVAPAGAAPVDSGLVRPSASAAPPPDHPAAAAPSGGSSTSPGRQAAEETSSEARTTPLARRIASEHGVDLNQVTGTGPSGRITKEDVNRFLQSQPAAVQQSASASAAAQPEATPALVPPADAGAGRREERVRMSRRRLTIANRLVEAQHTAAMLTTFNEVDMSAVLDLRKRRREAFKERYGINLGFMSFFTRAAVGALKAFPRLNAEIQGDEMVLKHYYDIGIAVGAEEGLVVPVVRDADRLSFAEIERQIASLAEKARNNQLSLSDLQGGTFTITNGGVFGSLFSTPILNFPQSGILGMHKIEERPMAVDGQVVIRPMMYLALSYDHRIVDGREAVQFLVRVKEMIEDPETLLLEG